MWMVASTDGGAQCGSDEDAPADGSCRGALEAPTAGDLDGCSLRECLRRAQAGDTEAFGRVYAQLSPRVYGLCRRMLGASAAAEDATSEVFERAQRALDRYDLERPFEPWLLTIARRHCLYRLRGERTERGLFRDEEVDVPASPRASSPLSVLEGRRERDALRRAIDGLADNYRVPLVLKYFEDLSYDEIADHLGITRNHVAVLLHRAKRALRETMQDEGRDR